MHQTTRHFHVTHQRILRWRNSSRLRSCWGSGRQRHGGQGSPQLARRRGATSRSANCDSGGFWDHFRWQTHRKNMNKWKQYLYKYRYKQCLACIHRASVAESWSRPQILLTNWDNEARIATQTSFFMESRCSDQRRCSWGRWEVLPPLPVRYLRRSGSVRFFQKK